MLSHTNRRLSQSRVSVDGRPCFAYAGASHPALVPLDRIDILDDRFGTEAARAVFQYQPGWGLPKPAEIDSLVELMGPGGARLHDAA